MNEQPCDENGFINLEEYEIIPEETPENETPRQYLLRMTGRDFPDLSYNGRDFSWQDLRETGTLRFVSRVMELAYKPRILLRKKE